MQHDARIWEIYASTFDYPSILVADELGVFATLSDQPRSLDELCSQLGIKKRAIGAVVAKLASLGLLCQDRDQRWTSSEDARRYLTPGSPTYWGAMFKIAKRNTPIFGEIMKAIECEKFGSKSTHILGSSWREGSITQELANAYAHGIHSQVSASSAYLGTLNVFSGVRKVLDVGSGPGTFAIDILRNHSKAKATLLDLDPIITVAKEYIANAGVSDRVDYCVANFFKDAWPVGFDGVLISNIFHNWRDQDCEFFAKQSYESLVSKGQIFIHEILLHDDWSGPYVAASFSLAMLVRTEGRQYTFSEVKEILECAGFENIRRIPSAGYYSLVVGEKP